MDLAAEVGRKEARKLKARRYKPWSALAGFGLLGLVGWSVVLFSLLAWFRAMLLVVPKRRYAVLLYVGLLALIAIIVLGWWFRDYES